MSGLAMGRQLKRAGVTDFLIAERADGPGGVWRANAYPGAACDVPSHLYSYSFFPNPDWSRKFAPQVEIKAYFERASAAFGLEPHIHYGKSVRALTYLEAEGVWRVEFEDDETLFARAVISAVGQLSEPFSPTFEGRDQFKGQIVHTAEWTPDIDMAGKRVVMIGSAASAIQVLPHAAKAAKALSVFQRTPNWIIPKPDRAFTPVEKWLFRHAPGYHWLYRMGSFALHELRWPAFRSGGLAAAYTRHRLTRRIKSQVEDAAVLDQVLPDYAPGCKRILLSNDFL
jgi:cation diffusion facilitator CzcD-associated flavoprotein CzcO